MDLIDCGPAKIITIGLEPCSKVLQGLLKPLELGNKMFQKFAETKLFKKSKRIFFTNYTAKYRQE